MKGQFPGGVYTADGEWLSGKGSQPPTAQLNLNRFGE